MTDRLPPLDRWTPAGARTTDYAVELLSSTHSAEVEAAQDWLLERPEEAVPALIAALHTSAAQAAAQLLGELDDPASVPALVAAYERGGEGLRSAVESGLERQSNAAAAEALRELRGGSDDR
jgi:HEAT repeat protein